MDVMTFGGFNDYAESNRIIVLYPQQAAVACWQGCGRSLPSDPGYDLYDTTHSRQLNVVNRMVDWIGLRFGVPPRNMNMKRPAVESEKH